MNYEYMRKLTNRVSLDIHDKIVKRLLEKDIEVYEKTTNDSFRGIAILNMSGAERRFSIDNPDDGCISDVLYVSAADLEYARRCVTELGMEQYLCPLEETQVVKSEAEKAEEEYYKKRKIRLIECAVVILAAAIYMIYKSLFG